MEYKHVEAYSLMQYRCEKCGKTELVWNSRDGVTPFVISCRSCNGSMIHINWGQDRMVPDFIPPVGSRIFVDLTMNEYLVIQRQFIDACWGSQSNPMHLHFKNKGEALKRLTADFHEGMPNIQEIKGEVQCQQEK